MAEGNEGGVAITPLRRGGAKLMRVRASGWTQRKRTCFLDMLAATAHVGMAAKAAGMGVQSAYALRRREPDFAASWAAALESGYERLEGELLSKALGNDPNAVDAVEPGGEAVMPAIDPDLALRVLALRRAEGVGARMAQRRGYKYVPIEEVMKVLAKNLAVVEARLQRRLGR